jgi:hypothetical protein
MIFTAYELTLMHNALIHEEELMHEETRHTRTHNQLNFLLGAWLIVSPWILGYTSSAAKWDQALFGAIVMVLAAIHYFKPEADWASWLNGMCALWLIVAPFLLSYDRTVAYWNQVIAGVFIAVLAFWSMDSVGENYHHST